MDPETVLQAFFQDLQIITSTSKKPWTRKRLHHPKASKSHQAESTELAMLQEPSAEALPPPYPLALGPLLQTSRKLVSAHLGYYHWKKTSLKHPQASFFKEKTGESTRRAPLNCRSKRSKAGLHGLPSEVQSPSFVPVPQMGCTCWIACCTARRDDDYHGMCGKSRWRFPLPRVVNINRRWTTTSYKQRCRHWWCLEHQRRVVNQET